MIQPLQAHWKQSTLNCCYVGKGNILEHYKSSQQLNGFSEVMNHQNSFLFAGNGKELSLDCTLGCIFVVLDIWNPYLYSTELTGECGFGFLFLKRWKKETEVAAYCKYFVFCYNWIILYSRSSGLYNCWFLLPKEFPPLNLARSDNLVFYYRLLSWFLVCSSSLVYKLSGQ